MESLSDEQVRALVLRNIKRMDGASRAQLALFLGHDISRDPIDEVGSGVDDGELRKLVQSCALLRERYAAFLRENPSALDAPAPSPERPKPYKPVAFAAAAVALALIPLIAQYVHQRGMVSGPDQATIAAIVPAPFVRKVASAVHAPSHAKPPVHRRAPHRATTPPPQRHVAMTVPAAHSAMHVRAKRNKVRYKRIAYWKFAPQNNPYFTRRWGARGRHAVAQHRAHAPRAVAVADGVTSRAGSVVSSYLLQVIHGGMPRAPENAIVSPTTNVHVVSIHPAPDRRMKVDVELSGPRGAFFEVFYVARDSMQIVDSFYIPITRTAANGLENRR